MSAFGAAYRWAQGNALRAAFVVGLAVTLFGCCVLRTEPAHDAGAIGTSAIVPERRVVGFPLVVWSAPDTHAETDWNFGEWPLRRFFVFWADVWLNGLPALLGLLAHRATTVTFAMPRLLGTLLLVWVAYPLLVAPLLLSHWGDVSPRAPLAYALLYARTMALSPIAAWGGVLLMAAGWAIFAFPPRPVRLPVFVPPPPHVMQEEWAEW